MKALSCEIVVYAGNKIMSLWLLVSVEALRLEVIDRVKLHQPQRAGTHIQKVIYQL